MNYKQYQVVLVNLDPTIGSEIKKTRPCVIISPNEMNDHLNTIIIAPLTSTSKNYPSRIPTLINERKSWIVLDQIRTIDKKHVIKLFDSLSTEVINELKHILKEMLVD